MRIYGLIGSPLSHSWSEKYFTSKFLQENRKEESYHNFPLSNLSEFIDLIHFNDKLFGLNVTFPWKEKIIPFLDELDPIAKEIGSVNTVKIIREKGQIKTRGYNTDAEGFMQSLKIHLSDTNALILGTGGASKAVEYILKKLGTSYKIISRKTSGNQIILYQDLNDTILNKYTFIINTTPCGMFPEINDCPPIPYALLTASHFLYDLIYNPAETLFLKKGRQKGTRTQNGLEMLKIQADLSDQIFRSSGF